MHTELLHRAVLAAIFSGLLACAPLFVLGVLRREALARRAALLVFALFVLDSTAVYLPTVFGAQGITWACLGKLFQFLLLIVAGTRLKALSWRFPTGKSWLRWFPAVALLTLLPGLLTLEVSGNPPGGQWLLYQASLPGLVEEFVYRGLMLSLIDAGCGRPFKVLGQSWGWGVLVTTTLFYFAHAMSLDQDFALHLDLSVAPDFALYGVAMCWLRYRFDSVWPSVFAHNLHNLLLLFMNCAGA